MSFYAVANGRRTGVFETWAECKQEVNKFSGAIYKKFPSKLEADKFVDNYLKSNKIKQEEPDYIPLQTTPHTMWFEDTEGDKELLEAFDALKEYPDVNSKPIITGGGEIKQDPSGNINTVDKDGYVDVYVGGNSENVGQWNCTAGYGIYFGRNHPLNVTEAASGRMTRNVEAAIAAIESAQRVGIPKLRLHTRSEFLLNAVASWMNIWKRNGWRNKNGKVVQNRKQFEKLDALLNDNSIDIKWSDARKESE
ncbi:ribonuclease H1-like [Anastrepha obliqua]|uniref:ribonuclease H1-like n=1 Tax=Anastrepha obliqua TaxID=95512 RepID=UPI002408FB1B|nr:ribonuclease H1-like [Anastrepha obliqua]